MSLHTIQHEILAIEEILEQIRSKYFDTLKSIRSNEYDTDVGVWIALEIRDHSYNLSMYDDFNYDTFIYIEEFGSIRAGLMRFEDAIIEWISRYREPVVDF